METLEEHGGGTCLCVTVHENLGVILLDKVLPHKLKAMQLLWGSLLCLGLRLHGPRMASSDC